MAETPNRVEPVEPRPAKEPYSTPRLVRHGTVEEITQGTSGIIIGDPLSAP